MSAQQQPDLDAILAFATQLALDVSCQDLPLENGILSERLALQISSRV